MTTQITTFAEALNHVLKTCMMDDPDIVLFGEDVGAFGGRGKVTKDLLRLFGPERVIDTGLNEELFVGIAHGAAYMGLRPIVEICHAPLLLLALADIVRVGQWSQLSPHHVGLPIVLRVVCNWGVAGPELSFAPLSNLLAVDGIEIAVPSRHRHADELLRLSLTGNKLVVLLEHSILYHEKEEEELCVRRRSGFEVTSETGRGELRSEGGDVSIITYGALNTIAAEATAMLKMKGISADHLDLVYLKPLDREAIIATIAKTGRVLVLGDESAESSFLRTKLFDVIKTASTDIPFAYLGRKKSHVRFGARIEELLPLSTEVVSSVEELMRA